MEELRQIALELLDSYEYAEESNIGEYCTHDFRGQIERLCKECADLREHIVNIT